MTQAHLSATSDDEFVDRAAMEASFTSVRRTLIAGLFTAAIVVGGFLLSGGASWAVTLSVAGGIMLTRFLAAWTASQGIAATDIAEQRLWTKRLEWALVPMGFLSGVAPSFTPQIDGSVSPSWFGLLVCAIAVAAANVLLGYGRSRTFLALALPLVIGAALSAALVGGVFALFYIPGSIVVGAILVFDNREAGKMFRDARRFEEENQALVTELRRANAQLHQRVQTDALTGLSNRAGLRMHIESLAETDAEVEVIYLDLDGFKAINDEQGHAVGDMVLATIGERLSRTIRSDDCAARLGGDEFAIIAMVDRTPTNALTKRIRETLERPIETSECSLRLGVSIGSHRVQPGEDIGLAMRLADAAMYDEKRDHRRSAAEHLPDELTSNAQQQEA